MFEREYKQIENLKEFYNIINKANKHKMCLEHLSNLYNYSNTPKFREYLLSEGINNDLSNKVYYRENIPKNNKFCKDLFYVTYEGKRISYDDINWGDFYFKLTYNCENIGKGTDIKKDKSFEYNKDLNNNNNDNDNDNKKTYCTKNNNDLNNIKKINDDSKDEFYVISQRLIVDLLEEYENSKSKNFFFKLEIPTNESYDISRKIIPITKYIKN